MRRILFTLLLGLFLSACESADVVDQKQNSDQLTTTPVVIEEIDKPAEYVTVKYRNNRVDISDFEELDTSKSSFVRGAWYDEENEYMVIKLNSAYYHYCEMPKSVWNQFKGADSFGKHYNGYLRGNYDCREGHVPKY